MRGFVLSFTVALIVVVLSWAPAGFCLDPCSLVEELINLPEDEAQALFSAKTEEPAEGSGTVKEIKKTGRGATQMTLIVQCADTDGFVYLTGKGLPTSGLSEGATVSYTADCTHWKKNLYRESDKAFIAFGCYDPVFR